MGRLTILKPLFGPVIFTVLVPTLQIWQHSGSLLQKNKSLGTGEGMVLGIPGYLGL